MLSASVLFSITEVARRFAAADIPYCLGGSAMLRLAGVDVAVNDVDVVVGAGDRQRVESAFADLEVVEPPPGEPWLSEWVLRTTLKTPSGHTGVDVIGGLALVIDGQLARFPLEAGATVSIEKTVVPLAPLAHWYHLYRVHDPRKAELVALCLGNDEIMVAARELGIAR